MATVPASVGDEQTLVMGTGSETAYYFEFGEALSRAFAHAESADISIRVIPTDGSVDNLQRMQNGEIDLAIVQNDVAYYMYEGIRGYQAFDDFSAGLPLFEEYIMVLVREDSEYRTLGELENKTISLGSDGSGSYHNGVDLLGQAGFRAGVDFQAEYLDISESLPKLLAGEIDAVIHTGGVLPTIPSRNPNRIRVLSLSREIVRSMASRSPYYVAVEPAIRVGQDSQRVSTVSLTAFLVFSDRIKHAQARAIIEQIEQIGAGLYSGSGRQAVRVPIELTSSTKPVPLHRGARTYLIETGYVASNSAAYWLLITGAALIGLCVYAHAHCSAYDRLGNVRSASGTWQYRFMLLLSQFNSLVIVVVLFIALIFVLVELIQFFETEYARQYNIRNQFADIGFWDAVLWMFMFMGSGHTNDIFPLSSQGRVLATALPFLGIGSVLGFLFVGFDRARERSAERKRGRLPVKARNHVLVCGWNDKAKGIVYGLTSDDVPQKRHVVVVADIDGDMPLQGHDFNPRYVFYQRGDSADHTVLSRANVAHADAAVVVAGVKKRAGRNVRSILSVMALKEAFAKAEAHGHSTDRKLFVAAELLFDENRPLFRACGADAIVTAEVVANRVAAQCCVNNHVVDFVLDALTYDDAAELYSTRIGRIGEAHGLVGQASRLVRRVLRKSPLPPPLVGRTLKEARSRMASFGINIVGMSRSRDYNESFLGDVFDNDNYRFPQDPVDQDLILEEEHVLLFFANDHDDVHIAATQVASEASGTRKEHPGADSARISIARRSILLVGDWGRCSVVRDMLNSLWWCNVRIVVESAPIGARDQAYVAGSFADFATWKKANLLDTDHIMILTQPAEQINLGEAGDHGEEDAQAIFVARFAQKFFHQLAACNGTTREQPTIAAEMVGHRNRSLFVDAGVDIIVPSSLLVERMLTKLVYSKGSVCRFLMALLAFDDDRHLITITLNREEHESLIDLNFQELMAALPTEAQLLGVLPAAGQRREKLSNQVEDFGYHILTCPDSNGIRYRSEIGDELLLILNRTLWTESLREKGGLQQAALADARAVLQSAIRRS